MREAPGTCQCAVIPERPCGAAITQEDLLCDHCRAARQPGMIHASFSLSGPTVTTISHVAMDMRAVYLHRGGS